MLLMTTIATDAPTASQGGLAWIITALALGLVLWAAGGGIIRPAVGVLGLAAGAVAGRMVWLETGVGPEWVLPTVGALACACVALLAWHLASGALLALLAALLAASITWSIATLAAPEDAPVPTPPVAGLFGLDQPSAAADADTDDHSPENTREEPTAPTSGEPQDSALAAVEQHLQSSEELAPVRAAWPEVPADERFAILVAAGIAALMGLLLAALASRTSAILLTALGGSLLVVCALPRLASALGASDLGLSPSNAALTAIGAWTVLALLGVLIQSVLASPTPVVVSSPD